MGGHEARTYWEHRGLLLLWVSLLSGPAAWTVNQLAGYALVKPVCVSGQYLALAAISAAALTAALAGVWIGARCLRRLAGADLAGGGQANRSRFLAISAIGLNLLLALLIATAAVPPFILQSCE
jgi:hypothetical protein